jgi:hypothetical protein
MDVEADATLLFGDTPFLERETATGMERGQKRASVRQRREETVEEHEPSSLCDDPVRALAQKRVWHRLNR